MSMVKPFIVATIVLALSACGTHSDAAVQLTVSGHPVSMALYTSLVAAERQKIERTGAPVSPTSARGKNREKSIEASVIRELVRDANVLGELTREFDLPGASRSRRRAWGLACRQPNKPSGVESHSSKRSDRRDSPGLTSPRSCATDCWRPNSGRWVSALAPSTPPWQRPASSLPLALVCAATIRPA